MTTTATDPRDDSVFRGGGELGALMRAFDWAATPLGPVAGWPLSLRTAVAILLNTRHPMFIWWGPQLIQFYNDGYRRSLGPDRHPSALGRRGRECWAEIWPTIGPDIDAIMAGGPATWYEDRLVPITRGTRLEEVYWSYSYSPLPDDAGDVGGVLVTVQETTQRVVTERRARLLQELATRALEAASEADAMAAAGEVLAAHPEEVAFALLYLRDGDGDGAPLRLQAAAGLAAGDPLGPAVLARAAREPWPVARALAERAGVTVALAPGAVPPAPDGWPEPVCQALVVPLPAGKPRGLLIAGLSPRRPAGDDARRFFEQVAREIGFALDRTSALEQERRDASLHAAERRRFAQVLELSPTFLAVLRGPDHVIELANPAYRQLIGFRDVLKRPIGDALAELAGQGFLELLERVYRSGEPFVGNELPVRIQRGPDTGLETRFVNFVYQPMRNPAGEVDGILASGTDVTDMVRAREAAERLAGERDLERRQLLTVLQQAPLAIILVDAASGRMTFANQRVRQIVGPDALSGTLASPVRPWLHPDGRPMDPGAWPIARALRGEIVANETVLVDDGGGRRAEIVLNAAPVRDAQGEILAAVAMFWDVTDERRVERQLRNAERMQAVGTLAGGVAHEVNNQMSVVLGFGEFILRALGPDHPEAADLRVVLSAADRTARITNQLLAFSRQQLMQPQPVALPTLVSGLRPILERLLGSDKALALGPLAATWPVLVDPTQVEQTLINLVANARDATETGDRVTIAVRDVEITPDAARAAPMPIVAGHYVMLEVTDTGRGMDPDTLARAFEPFFTTKPVGEGTGLGLAMVYGIVKRHGGYISAESGPGRGATFRIYWPAPAEPDPGDDGAAAGGEEPGSSSPARRAAVLVVEDEPAVRELIRRILVDERYQVVTAEDGHAALHLVASGAVMPGLVLTDVMMPRLNGRQLGDAVGQLRPGLPVIYMSGDVGESQVLRELLQDGTPFLRKPFTPAQLLEVVEGALAAGA